MRCGCWRLQEISASTAYRLWYCSMSLTLFFGQHCETTTAFSPPNIWSSDFFRSDGKLFGELIDRKIVFRHKCQGVSEESFLTLTTNLYFPCVSLVSSRLSFTHLTLLFRPPLCQHSTNFEKRLWNIFFHSIRRNYFKLFSSTSSAVFPLFFWWIFAQHFLAPICEK